MNWQNACTESEACRRLNLPDSRRNWLRNKLPNIPIGGLIVYELDAVTRLATELEGTREAAVRGQRTPLDSPAAPGLFTR